MFICLEYNQKVHILIEPNEPNARETSFDCIEESLANIFKYQLSINCFHYAVFYWSIMKTNGVLLDGINDHLTILQIIII